MILKNRNIFGCLIMSMTTLGLVLTQAIFILDPVLGQTSEITTAAIRGFFNLTTGDGLRPVDSDSDGRCDIRNPDGSCSILLSGDNHFGNLGYRDTPTSVSNNGAIDRVAIDWKEQQ